MELCLWVVNLLLQFQLEILYMQIEDMQDSIRMIIKNIDGLYARGEKREFGIWNTSGVQGSTHSPESRFFHLHCMSSITLDSVLSYNTDSFSIIKT